MNAVLGVVFYRVYLLVYEQESLAEAYVNANMSLKIPSARLGLYFVTLKEAFLWLKLTT